MSVRENFTVERTSGGYRITANIPGVHRLFYSKAPQGFTDDFDLGSFEGEITVADPLPGSRCYFHIMTGSVYSVAALRRFEISGLINCREAGGFNTADGSAFIRHGVFIRSERLCDADDEGKAQIKKLGLKTVLDFRLASEAQKFPDPELGSARSYNLEVIDHSCMIVGDVMRAALVEGGEIADRAAKDLADEYRKYPFNDAYRRMFEILLEGGPILIHCTSGKDRTGIALALIMTVLGIPRETIFYDYMLSAEYREQRYRELMRQYGEYLRSDGQKQLAESIFSVQKESLASSFDAIHERYGSNLGAYFGEILGLDDKKIERLKDLYLIKHKEGLR